MEIEFLRSHTQSWVPVVDGTLLHSLANPEREAEKFISSQWALIERSKAIIVFGLGGGFHIQELLLRKDFNIVVIEKSQELTKQLGEKNQAYFEKIDVLAGLPCDMIFKEPVVINACSQPFSILQHHASFRLSRFYYTSILKSLNQRTVNDLKELTKNNTRLNRFLYSLDINGDQLLTLPMIEEALHRRGADLEQEGYIWMAMRELIV